MNISYNEFHVGKKIRDLCKFDGKLYASTGNVILANMKNVRLFADKLTQILTNADTKKNAYQQVH